MIATIKSNKEVTILSDDRGGAIETGIVQIELTEVTHRLSDDSRLIRIEDFKLTPYDSYVDVITSETIPAGFNKKRLKINGKDFKIIVKTKDEYEGLLSYFETTYPNASCDDMLKFALLSDTQNNPIYGSVANDWE